MRCTQLEPCRNGWTDQDAVWDIDSGEAKEPYATCSDPSPQEGALWGTCIRHPYKIKDKVLAVLSEVAWSYLLMRRGLSAMLPTGRCHATKGRAAAAAMRSVATVTVQIVVTGCWLVGCSGWRSGRWRRQADAHVVHASPDARARERVPLQPLPDAPPAHRGDPTWPFVYCCVPVGQRGVLWWACLSVCLSVCVSIYPRNYSPIFTKFFVHVTYGRGSVVLWRRNDTLRISGFWGWRHICT